VARDAVSLRAALEGGALDPDRLAVAAHAGDPAAREALGEAAPPPCDDLREWVLALEDWGVVPCLVAALVAVAALREVRDRGEIPASRLKVSRQADEAARAYIACPCAEHELAARKGWTRDEPWAYEFSWADIAAEIAWDAGWAIRSHDELRERMTAELLRWAFEGLEGEGS
jgi:hypothetical protein